MRARLMRMEDGKVFGYATVGDACRLIQWGGSYFTRANNWQKFTNFVQATDCVDVIVNLDENP
jgi:hypothetical protein